MNIEQPNLSEKAEERQSVPGIASLSSGLLAILFFLILLLDIYLVSIDPAEPIDPIKAFLLNATFWLFPIATLAGIIFGVIGLFHNNDKKKIAIIGLVLSIFMGVVACVSLALALLAMGGM